MKSLRTAEALRAIAEVGYDAVELSLWQGYPTEPTQLSSGDRIEIRRMLADYGLVLASLEELRPLLGGAEVRARNLEGLKRAITLGQDLSPDRLPFVQTTLGLEAKDWEAAKDRMADELRDWARVAEDSQMTICFKPHAGQAVNTTRRALWLARQVGNPRIRLTYDYSHLHLAGLSLESSLRQLYPYIGFIHVKDSRGTESHPEFLLPGDGNTDYLGYFRLLKKLGYASFIIVEVSVMIQEKPGYQPISAARQCYGRLAPLMSAAGVRRPDRRH
jgi:sugar phosphate isomerase/epimerase